MLTVLTKSLTIENCIQSCDNKMKTSSSKAAISMIIVKPENEILLLQDILPCFIVIALSLNKMSKNAF